MEAATNIDVLSSKTLDTKVELCFSATALQALEEKLEEKKSLVKKNAVAIASGHLSESVSAKHVEIAWQNTELQPRKSRKIMLTFGGLAAGAAISNFLTLISTSSSITNWGAVATCILFGFGCFLIACNENHV